MIRPFRVSCGNLKIRNVHEMKLVKWPFFCKQRPLYVIWASKSVINPSASHLYGHGDGLCSLVFVVTKCWIIYENFEPHHKSLGSPMRATLYANWVFFQNYTKKIQLALLWLENWIMRHVTNVISSDKNVGDVWHIPIQPRWILCDRMSYSLQIIWSQNITQTIKVHSALISTIKTSWICSNLL